MGKRPRCRRHALVWETRLSGLLVYETSCWQLWEAVHREPSQSSRHLGDLRGYQRGRKPRIQEPRCDTIGQGCVRHTRWDPCMTMMTLFAGSNCTTRM